MYVPALRISTPISSPSAFSSAVMHSRTLESVGRSGQNETCRVHNRVAHLIRKLIRVPFAHAL